MSISADLPVIWRHATDVAVPILKNTGSLVAALAIGKLLLDLWRGTFGRRRRWLKLYRQLSLGLQVDYLFELFGKAAYKRVVTVSPGEDTIEYVWPLSTDGYLQAIISSDETVVRYSLTSCSRRFKPKLQMGGPKGTSSTFKVKLGSTRFADLPGEISDVYLVRGASYYEYGENRYVGRPGKYAHWICSYNVMGTGHLEAISIEIPVETDSMRLPPSWYEGLSEADQENVRQSRAKTVVNTVTISDSNGIGPDGGNFGPRYELVERRLA
ncbi:ETEC_3214 domain-containing protein [Amycolatopsis sp. NBC_01480]|uniref:ETEC_3214 domain-containing protein n=1 Tax=Amycolatopsis sp. NBC_01480 TaxID=2903562 RepID=UPI002E2C311B|nr:ETEC_3214 domain-containing protein [Amycolatopsis sp. NBC_01480]